MKLKYWLDITNKILLVIYFILKTNYFCIYVSDIIDTKLNLKKYYTFI